MKNTYLLALSLILFLFSCGESDSNSLQDFIDNKESSDELVACAATYLVFPISGFEYRTAVYYKTLPGQSNLQLWYSEEYSQSIENYKLIESSDQPQFSGFLGLIEDERQTGAFIVSVNVGDEIIYSKPIEILTLDTKTVIDDAITIDFAQNLEPTFTWPTSSVDDQSIYFHLIVDLEQEEAISGTYSYETNFTFYDLQNVVFNVTEKVDPVLEPNKEYLIQIMDVSDNNWVTKISRTTFFTN